MDTNSLLLNHTDLSEDQNTSNLYAFSPLHDGLQTNSKCITSEQNSLVLVIIMVDPQFRNVLLTN